MEQWTLESGCDSCKLHPTWKFQHRKCKSEHDGCSNGNTKWSDAIHRRGSLSKRKRPTNRLVINQLDPAMGHAMAAIQIQQTFQKCCKSTIHHHQAAMDTTHWRKEIHDRLGGHQTLRGKRIRDGQLQKLQWDTRSSRW